VRGCHGDNLSRHIAFCFVPVSILEMISIGQKSALPGGREVGSGFFKARFFLTNAAAHVPPFAFVLLQKTAESWKRNRQKEEA
jgi:hypothetical protein